MKRLLQMMKNRYIAMAAAVFLVAACGNNKDEQAKNPDTTTSFQPMDKPEQNNIAINKSEAIWSVDYDTASKEFHLRKNKNLHADSLSIHQLIQSVNEAWQPLTIRLEKISHDTVHISVNDAAQMSSDMGSAGSEQFIAAVTYTLTEVKNIHYVNFAFPAAGDHAEPGVYSREDFIDFMKKP